MSLITGGMPAIAREIAGILNARLALVTLAASTNAKHANESASTLNER